MSSSRRTTILLLVLLAAAAYYAFDLLSGGGSGSGGISARARSGVGTRRTVAEVEELATTALEKKPGVYQHGRDLFTYGAANRPKAQRPRPKRQPPKPKPAQTEVKPAATEPAGPKPPPIDVSYLGSFGPEGRRIAVFSDGENVYNALLGDVIKKKFVLVAIGYESADLGFVGFPEAAPSRLAAGRMR